MDYRALVLFDIDGTLVRRTGPYHREALSFGIRKATGIKTTTDGIPVHGMLDPDILSRMMKNAGANAATIRAALPAVYDAAERHYLRTCPDLSDKHCPSVIDTLDRLQDAGAMLALVTGNLTRIGWHKLERAGLRGYFHFGAFGETAPTRTDLARNAIRVARERGWIAAKAPIALVGDATSDIRAARGNRIQAISVKTGITPSAELAALEPDRLLATLRDLRLPMLGL